MSECWAKIPGYLDRYEVSDLGRVRSWCNNRGLLVSKPRVLKPGTRGSRGAQPGYYFVILYGAPGVKKHESVHRLVLAAFGGVCPKDFEGAHLNGDPLDNRAVNLAWVSRGENAKHKHAHGTSNTLGEANVTGKLTRDLVLEIRRLRAEGLSGPCLAARYGVSCTTIYDVASGRFWSHI